MEMILHQYSIVARYQPDIRIVASLIHIVKTGLTTNINSSVTKTFQYIRERLLSSRSQMNGDSIKRRIPNCVREMIK